MGVKFFSPIFFFFLKIRANEEKKLREEFNEIFTENALLKSELEEKDKVFE